jgi:excisionase family DNA binding protein
MTTPASQSKFTFEQLPEVIASLINEVAELKILIQLQVTAEPDKHFPVGIYKASKIIGKSIGTIYNLTSTKKIPYYKDGNQLYFYEDELLAYIERGRNGFEK